MSSLIRSQRRLAVLVFTVIAGLLVGTALLGAWSAGFDDFTVEGISLPWVVLGILIYPVLIGLAAYSLHQAEQNERAFTELVRRK